MAGGAASCGMNLAGADKRRDGGVMTANAVDGCRAGSCILLDRVGVVVIVAVEVGGVAGRTGAAITTVDPGVTVAIGPIDAGAVDTGVAGEAVVFMNRAHGVTGMAGDAKRS